MRRSPCYLCPFTSLLHTSIYRSIVQIPHPCQSHHPRAKIYLSVDTIAYTNPSRDRLTFSYPVLFFSLLASIIPFSHQLLPTRNLLFQFRPRPLTRTLHIKTMQDAIPPNNLLLNEPEILPTGLVAPLVRVADDLAALGEPVAAVAALRVEDSKRGLQGFSRDGRVREQRG